MINLLLLYNGGGSFADEKRDCEGGDKQPYSGYFLTVQCRYLAEKSPHKIRGLSAENEKGMVIYHPLKKLLLFVRKGEITHQN